MILTFLTTEEPLYLSAFYERVLPVLKQRHSVRVYAVPPLYKNQSASQAAWRYFRTFGPIATAHLVVRVLAAKLTGRSVANVCQRLGVPHQAVADVNQQEFLERLRTEKTELLVSVSCPQIFKTPLIALPPRGTLNIHGAILPQYRGVMPSFWMLANGEKQAGVSIYLVNEAIDAGELCGQKVFEIQPAETLAQFLRRSKSIAAELLLETIESMERDQLAPRPLDLSKGSYYSWPDPEAVRRFRRTGRKLW